MLKLKKIKKQENLPVMIVKVVKKNRIPIIFAHRGASGHEYENSFSSFDLAIELGADGLETDCWLLKDGKVALHHDKAVKMGDMVKLTNISKMDSEELKSHSLPNGEQIPLLREFFERYVNKKSKSGNLLRFSIDCQDLKVGRSIVPLLEEFALIDRTYLCATRLFTLKKIRRENSHVKLVASNLGTHIDPEQLKTGGKIDNLKIEAFNVKAESFKEVYIDVLKTYGYKLFVWDLHTQDILEKYLKKDIDAVYSNYPDLAVKTKARIFEDKS